MKIIDCEQYSPEWWEYRRGIPTASEFHRIMSPVKFAMGGQKKYIAQLIAERMCQTPNFFTDSGNVRGRDSEETRRGREREAEARAWYALERNVRVIEVGMVKDDDGRWGGSPDGLIIDKETGVHRDAGQVYLSRRPIGGLELKCPREDTQTERLMDGGLPDEYKCQVHGHLWLTGLPWWDWMSYSPPLPPLLLRVFPYAFTAKLGAAVEAFHEKLMESIGRISNMGGNHE